MNAFNSDHPNRAKAVRSGPAVRIRTADATLVIRHRPLPGLRRVAGQSQPVEPAHHVLRAA
ncbi:MAG: hypothetical protein ABII82_08665 [Verrucomicrobiota bacterium]